MAYKWLITMASMAERFYTIQLVALMQVDIPKHSMLLLYLPTKLGHFRGELKYWFNDLVGFSH